MKTKQLIMAVLTVLAMTVLNACNPEDALIKTSVAGTNMLCPIEIRDGVSLVHADYTDGYIIYSMQCDPEFADLAIISNENVKTSVVEQMKSSMTQRNKDNTALLDVFRKCDVGLTLRYFNEEDTVDIVFSPEDIRSLFE